jgi:hypothetical protein
MDVEHHHEEYQTYMKSFRIFLVSAALLLGLGVTTVSAVTLDWEGVTWDDYKGTISVNVDGNLEATTTGPGACDNSGAGPNCLGAAHYNTPDSLRNAPGHSVTVTFIDDGPGTHGMQIWATKDDSPSSWTQFGARDGATHYYILLLRFEPVFDYVIVELDVARTVGLRTLTIGKRADNTIDYFIDGDLVYTDTFLQLGYISDIYLAALSTISSPVSGVFTAYSTDNTYVEPVPQGRLCINSFTGAIRLTDGDCSSSETLHKLPFDGALILCSNSYTGSTRVSATGSCLSYERTIEALGDKSLQTCVSKYTGKMRIPRPGGSCTLYELETYI